jgi:hypothetical protein
MAACSLQVVVDLRGNGFGNAGAAALATALKQHTNEHLTELDIGYNEIKDDGACIIAQACHACLSVHSEHCALVSTSIAVPAHANVVCSASYCDLGHATAFRECRACCNWLIPVRTVVTDCEGGRLCTGL